jgi:hypothetical protein
MVVKYIAAMGYTPRRIMALCYGITGYLGILSFLVWAIRPPFRIARSGHHRGWWL